jgi:hypothetical protein
MDVGKNLVPRHPGRADRAWRGPRGRRLAPGARLHLRPLGYEGASVMGRSSGWSSLLRMEVRRRLVLWLAPFMAAALAWVVYEASPVEIWFWPDTVASIQYSLILYGPLVGGISV